MSNIPPIFCVYINPADYPGKIVIRRFLGEEADPLPTVIADNLNAARATLLKDNPYLVKMAPDKKDAPHIVETWI